MRARAAPLAGFAASLALSLASHPALSQDGTAPEPARALLERAFANRYDLDLSSVIELVVRSDTGQERRRTLHAVSKLIDGRIHSLGRLVAPEHLRGMTVLMMESEDRRYDSFLYLPSQGRVRRVSTAQRGDAFFGTDVTYADLERQRADDFALAAVEPGTRDGESVHLIEATPLREYGYARARFAIAAADLAILETAYWKRGAREPYRVIRAERASMVSQGGHVLPTHIAVESRDRGTTTEVWIRELRVDPEIDARLFSVKTLESQRPLPVKGR